MARESSAKALMGDQAQAEASAGGGWAGSDRPRSSPNGDDDACLGLLPGPGKERDWLLGRAARTNDLKWQRRTQLRQLAPAPGTAPGVLRLRAPRESLPETGSQVVRIKAFGTAPAFCACA